VVVGENKMNLSAIEDRRSQKNLGMKNATGFMPSRPKNHSLSGKGKNSIFLGKDNRGTSMLDSSTK
jgi:hypothetical protein